MVKPALINSNAMVSISLVIVMIGGVSWLTSIYERSSEAFNNGRAVAARQQEFQDKMTNKFGEIAERLAGIERDLYYLKELSKKSEKNR